jgi:hypothetical protein
VDSGASSFDENVNSPATPTDDSDLNLSQTGIMKLAIFGHDYYNVATWSLFGTKPTGV